MAVCFLNLFCKSCSVTLFPSMLVERYFASYYVDDYERMSRPWVAVVVIVISGLLASLYAAPLTFGLIHIDKLAIFTIGLCAVCSVVYIILYRRDRQRLNEFIVGPFMRYLLSARFQLIENLRVLKIIMNASVIYSVWVIVPCTMIVMVFHHFSPTTLIGQLVFAAFELFLTLSVVGLMLFSVIALGGAPKSTQLCSCLHRSRTVIYGARRHSRVNYESQNNHSVVTEQYFHHLKSAWK